MRPPEPVGHPSTPTPTSHEVVPVPRMDAPRGPTLAASRSRDRSRSRTVAEDSRTGDGRASTADDETSVRDEDVDHNSMHTEAPSPNYIVEQDGQQWLRLNYDSGAVSTVIPVEMATNQGMSLRRIGDYRVANGDKIPRYGRVRVPCLDENGLRRGFRATVTHVHKPLGSAGEFSDTHDAHVFRDGGFLIPKDSQFALDIRQAIEDAKRRHGTDELLKLHKEGNLYNLYLQQRGPMQDVNALDSGSEDPPNGRQGDP